MRQDSLPGTYSPFAFNHVARAGSFDRGVERPMPMNVDASLGSRELILRPTGTWPTGDDWATLRRHCVLTEQTSALIDLRRVVKMPDHVEIQIELARPISERHWPLRRAYLVRNAAQYGACRQIQAYAPDEMCIEIFTDEHAAIAWLTRTSAS